MAVYLGYTLQMKTLFRGWPVMVHGTRTRRRRLETFPVLCSAYSWTGDHFVDKLSAIGQPTRPTPPFNAVTCNLSTGVLKPATPCSKKSTVSCLMFDSNFGKCGLNFQNSFTRWFVRNFFMLFSSYLQYVATLPCESRKSKMLPNFHVESYNIFN